MKTSLLRLSVLLCSIFLFHIHYADAQTIAFQRDSNIWIADKDGNNQKVVCVGSDPDISQDGKYIAFSGSHGICYIDIQSKKIYTFKSITNSRSRDPRWSPDGKRLVFLYLKIPQQWTVGVVDLEDTYFKRLPEGAYTEEIWSPVWDREGKYILCHDNGNILKIDLDGQVISKTSYESTLLPYGISDTRFGLSPDGDLILFDAYVNNEDMKGLNEPPLAVFIYNLSTGRTARITPPGVCALHPCWMSGNRILFEGFTEKDVQGHQGKSEYETDINRYIYSIDIDGTNMKRLIVNGSHPSFSNNINDLSGK
jgi:Tol biopolymer transport system component